MPDGVEAASSGAGLVFEGGGGAAFISSGSDGAALASGAVTVEVEPEGAGATAGAVEGAVAGANSGTVELELEADFGSAAFSIAEPGPGSMGLWEMKYPTQTKNSTPTKVHPNKAIRDMRLSSPGFP